MSAPHKCPVCRGRGAVPAGFYDNGTNGSMLSSTTPTMCRACHGAGILWEAARHDASAIGPHLPPYRTWPVHPWIGSPGAAPTAGDTTSGSWKGTVATNA